MATPDPTAVIVVSCVCGQRWEGTAEDVIPLVQRHGIDLHNMAVTAEQVLAMAEPSGQA
jgi:hypothetical protein